MLSQEQNWLLEEKYHGEKSEAFYADVARLEDGEPLAYLIGSIPFLNTNIYLDSRPLIPRPETEYWTGVAIGEIKKSQHKMSTHPQILDLCAGSGCIGVAIAKSIPQAKVDFIEIERRHLPTIKKNCDKNGIESSRYQIWQSDLFTLKEATIDKKYNFIISNPPYIDKILNRTEQSVKDYEPSIALYGGKSGMELIEKIIEQSPRYILPKGQLWLEHEPEQFTTINQLAEPNFSITPHKDQYQVVRFTQLVLK